MLRKTLALAGIAVMGLWAAPGRAQDIVLPGVLELSGAGAVSGTMFRNGAAMAIEEINAKGGILGKKIKFEVADTASDPGKARAAVQRALDEKPIAILGPVFSGSVSATEKLTADAEVPQIMGGEAAPLTMQGSKYLFRTSFGQQSSMPKIANYLRDGVKAKSIAVVFVNNDFGKGGRDAIAKELAARNIKVVAEISTESGQADFAADVIKVKGANADAVFVYLNEDESARFLREAKKQGLNKPLVGETTLLGQKVIELAGDAANGVKGHVGLTIDAPIPAVQEWAKKYEAKFKSKSDHNGLKGYFAPYMIKVAAEKVGKLDPKAIAAALHGMTITPAQEPGILIEATWDANGDIDRISFLGEVKDGKQVITETLPKLNK